MRRPPDPDARTPAPQQASAPQDHPRQDRPASERTPRVSAAADLQCRCDRCARWPDSEVAPTSRVWLQFELLRSIDVVLQNGPASFTEVELLGLEEAV